MQLTSAAKKLLLPCLFASLGTSAISAPDMSFSGFATIAFAQTITDDKKEGEMEGMSNTPEFTYFNKLGLRLDTDLMNDLAFTLQMVANGNDDYQPKVDWAFVDYQATNSLKLSAGKLRMPLYMFSEYKDVSYAYQWITPPYAVYGAPDFATFNGAKVNYLTDLGGEWSSSIDFWIGQVKDKVEVGGIGGEKVNYNIDDLMGTSITLDRDWLSFRAVYMRGISSSDIAPLLVDQLNASPEIELLQEKIAYLAGINLAGTSEDDKTKITTLKKDTNSITQSDAVTLENDKVQFIGLGTTIDFNTVFFNAEATCILSDPNIIVGRAISYYILAGYRAPHDLTFSFTFAKDFNRPSKDALKEFKADYQQIASKYADGLSALDQAEIHKYSEAVLVRRFSTLDTKSYILSSRWDFHPSASLKAEYLYKAQTQFGLKTSPQSIRLAVDLVF